MVLRNVMGEHAFQSVNNAHKAARDAFAKLEERRVSLLQFTQKRSQDFQAMNNRRIASGNVPYIGGLPAWTSQEFLEGIVIPYCGNTRQIFEVIIESRCKEATENLLPLDLLMRASFFMVCRLGGLTKYFTASEYPLPADFRRAWEEPEMWDKRNDYMGERDGKFRAAMTNYNMVFVSGLYWKGGRVPRNYSTLIQTMGLPQNLLTAMATSSSVSEQASKSPSPTSSGESSDTSSDELSSRASRMSLRGQNNSSGGPVLPTIEEDGEGSTTRAKGKRRRRVVSAASNTPMTPTPKKKRPKKGAEQEAFDSAKKAAADAQMKSPRDPPPRDGSSTPFPIPIEKPSFVEGFVWTIISRYAKAAKEAQTATLRVELSEAEVATIEKNHIKHAIWACEKIARQIPMSYSKAHAYFAEKGVMAFLRGMERAVNEKRGTMTIVKARINSWIQRYGSQYVNIRGNHPAFGGCALNYEDVQSALFSGQEYDGHLTERFVLSSIAACRAAVGDDGTGMIYPQDWRSYRMKRPGYEKVWGWANAEDQHDFYLLPVYERHGHWFLIAAWMGIKKWVVFDTDPRRRSSKDQDVDAFEEYLEVMGWENQQQMNYDFPPLFNDFDSGVWITAVAQILLGTPSPLSKVNLDAIIKEVRELEIDYYTRAELIGGLMNFQQNTELLNWQKPDNLRVPLMGVETHDIDELLEGQMAGQLSDAV